MNSMKCYKCKGRMKLARGYFEEDGVGYDYYQCQRCGEEILNMAQLRRTAERYRALKKAKDILFQKWGNSIAVRIPKTFIESLGIKPNGKGLLLLEKRAMRIVP